MRICKAKVLVVVLFAVLFFALPVMAQAASSGTCGDELIWTLDDEGTLTISGTGRCTIILIVAYPHGEKM